MNKKYAPLFEPLTLPNGTTLTNRFALSPIVINVSTLEGYVTQEEIDYARRRAGAAGMQVTGAAYVEPYGQLFEYGIAAYDDRQIPGLRKLAQAMQSQGNKAILQLTHAGQFADTARRDYGLVYGPSQLQLNTPFPHTVYQMSQRKINQVIQQYKDAAKRAVQAGFEGVEISVAQRLLIQQFFSPFSNKRTDKYGYASFENRARLGIEIFKAVREAIKEAGAPETFILGFRGTPEEARGSEIGYPVEEFNTFVDQLLEVAQIDYYATASWGKNIYLQTIRSKKHHGRYMNEVVYEHFKGRLPIMATGGINSPEKALEAMQFADFVGMSTPFVTEPDFVIKLQEGHEETIDLSLTEDQRQALAIPKAAFKYIVYMMDLGGALPEETRDQLRVLANNYEFDLQ
ncbi:TPA: NADH-dependent flavin oxidoreductase [Enterococcus faecalis]|nr:NADH-dependent flavin oxidoreductase [Enterococcus faecalis]HEM7729933.1 NADH-dependent flavin oxidoreductase [Enterococcus faecalis]